MAVDEQFAASGLVEAEEGADGSGFAGTVGAEQAKDLTLFDGEGEVFDDFFAIKGHFEIFYLNNVAH